MSNLSEIDDLRFSLKNLENSPLTLREIIQAMISGLRQKILLEFVRDLTTALETENYALHEIVECLANLTDARGWSQATTHLDKASEKLLEIHNRIRSESGIQGDSPASKSKGAV